MAVRPHGKRIVLASWLFVVTAGYGISCGGKVDNGADAGAPECTQMPGGGEGSQGPGGGSCSEDDTHTCMFPWDRPVCGGGFQLVIYACTCDGKKWSCEHPSDDTAGNVWTPVECEASADTD